MTSFDHRLADGRRGGTHTGLPAASKWGLAAQPPSERTGIPADSCKGCRAWWGCLLLGDPSVVTLATSAVTCNDGLDGGEIVGDAGRPLRELVEIGEARGQGRPEAGRLLDRVRELGRMRGAERNRCHAGLTGL